MIKLLGTDIKRLLQSKASIIITLTAPVILVLLISLTIAPLYFSKVRLEFFSIAVLNEDEDIRTKVIVDSLVKSDALKNLVTVDFVDTKQQGLDSVQEGSVAFIHIPAGLQETLYSGGQVVINYYGNKNKPLENALLLETLVPGIELVNFSQNAVNELYNSIAAYDSQMARRLFSDTSAYLLIEGMASDDIYEASLEYSPISNILPVEFYASSLLLLFVGLGALPIARISEDDKKTGLILRHITGGLHPLKSFVSKWLAGGILLFAQYAVLCTALLAVTGRLKYFAGDAFMLFGCALLFCALLSLVSIIAGMSFRSAVFMSLVIVLSLAALGGLIIPSAYMPQFMRTVSGYTPFAPALRLSLAGMFNAAKDGQGAYFGLMAAYICLLFPAGYFGFVKRGQ